MSTVGSSVLGMPRTLFRATAIIDCCQYGTIGTSFAASTWIEDSSSPSSQRVTSKSCTAVSTIAMSLV